MRGEKLTNPVCLAVKPYVLEKTSELIAETRTSKSEAIPSASKVSGLMSSTRWKRRLTCKEPPKDGG